jgi:hypothetical protein
MDANESHGPFMPLSTAFTSFSSRKRRKSRIFLSRPLKVPPLRARIPPHSPEATLRGHRTRFSTNLVLAGGGEERGDSGRKAQR